MNRLSLRFLALLAINAALTGVLASLLLNDERTDAMALPKSAQGMLLPEMPSVNMPPFDAEQTYALLIDKPLFHQSRHFTPPPVNGQVEVETPSPSYMLTGFMGVAGRPGRAFLRPTGGGKGASVAVGDNLDGWTVISVGPKSVGLKQGERTASIGGVLVNSSVISSATPAQASATGSSNLLPAGLPQSNTQAGSTISATSQSATDNTVGVGAIHGAAASSQAAPAPTSKSHNPATTLATNGTSPPPAMRRFVPPSNSPH